jgi:hypothetical protein
MRYTVKPVETLSRQTRMRLYRDPGYMAHWFAWSPTVGWVIFPAEIAGWQKRRPVSDIDPIDVCEVPLRLGFNTGIPGAPMSAERGSVLTLPAVA